MSQERSRHADPARHTWRRWNRTDLAIILTGVLAFMGITFGAPLFQQAGPAAVEVSAAATPSPIDTSSPTATPAPTPAASPAQQALGPVLPAAAAPVRIRYASANFDVPVHPLEPDSTAQASQTIVPPETKDGYWLTPFGTPGQDSANTTYVIGHSWDGAEAPFNHLSSEARVGDRLEVDTASGTIAFQVDSVTTYLKSSLKDSPIWDIVPNRLVLISCYTRDPWGKNVVVTASPAVL